ncbi:hypothetical protein Baya_5388 [Bagarius yarrelli]|uniref:Uncharacterized protein n=1 Tax=Bagarius yarrelli TaxID=175774 RepID=A0A556TWN1_BAGYA|nr:hypothetical protein Baya_5388 [Bagarius yarrelli]
MRHSGLSEKLSLHVDVDADEAIRLQTSPQLTEFIMKDWAASKDACNQDETGSDCWEEGGVVEVTVNFCQARPRCLFLCAAEREDVHYSRSERVLALIIFNLIIHLLSFFLPASKRGGKADAAAYRPLIRRPSSDLNGFPATSQHYCAVLGLV